MKKLVRFSALNCSISTPTEKSHIDRFFRNLVSGEVFAYSDAFAAQEIKTMSAVRGVEIEFLNCGETKGEFSCRVL